MVAELEQSIVVGRHYARLKDQALRMEKKGLLDREDVIDQLNAGMMPREIAETEFGVHPAILVFVKDILTEEFSEKERREMAHDHWSRGNREYKDIHGHFPQWTPDRLEQILTERIVNSTTAWNMYTAADEYGTPVFTREEIYPVVNVNSEVGLSRVLGRAIEHKIMTKAEWNRARGFRQYRLNGYDKTIIKLANDSEYQHKNGRFAGLPDHTKINRELRQRGYDVARATSKTRLKKLRKSRPMCFEIEPTVYKGFQEELDSTLLKLSNNQNYQHSDKRLFGLPDHRKIHQAVKELGFDISEYGCRNRIKYLRRTQRIAV